MSRLSVPIRLRWSDLDAYGHVNNARMLTLLEEARIRVFWAAEGGGDPEIGGLVEGYDPAVLHRDGAHTQTVIAAQQVEYVAQLPYQLQPLDVQLWIGRIGGASVDVYFEVHARVDGADDVVTTRAKVTLVLIDATTGAPLRFPATARDAWAPYADEPLQFRR